MGKGFFPNLGKAQKKGCFFWEVFRKTNKMSTVKTRSEKSKIERANPHQESKKRKEGRK